MRKSTTKHFYLAIFALFGSCQARATGTTASHVSRADVCAVRSPSHVVAPKTSLTNDFSHQIEPTSIVSDACASYATLDTLNDAIIPSLKEITQKTDFFAYYRLNLYDQKCPVRAWDDETGTCGNIACKVDTLEDEKDIPEIWRVHELSKLSGPKAAHPDRQEQQERGSERPLQGDLGENVGESCVVEYDDECDERDYCVPEDESATAKGDYVSLVDNPERFTGYAGQPVWDAIYQENCFSKHAESAFPPSNSLNPLLPFQARNHLRSVLQQNAPSNDLPLDDTCLEKRVFHRIISGMHASISTHICYDYLNQSTGNWGPNLQCYTDRLATHPERISNLYFDYAILLRAVAKLRTYLKNYTFCSGDPSQDSATKAKILGLADTAAQPPPIFDERTMFQDPDLSVGLKEDFRNRFRNVSRLMDCTGCDKCRLWGKLQTVGFGTALKVLFEFDEFKNGENPPLRRTELVALVNTLDRVSSSLTALNAMREMVASSSNSGAALPAASSAKEEGKKEPDVVISLFPTPEPQKPAHRSKDRPHAKPVVAHDFHSGHDLGDDDDDEEEYERMGRQETVWEAFTDELGLVFRVWVYVLRSWVEMPGKAFRIGVMELNRLWSYWLGLPVQQRSWEIRWPQRDEL